MARLIAGGPLSPKLQAASDALDRQLETEGDTLTEAYRQDFIRQLVVLYQSNPQLSRDLLALYNKNPGRTHHGIGPEVHDRLIELGIVDRPATWVPPQDRPDYHVPLALRHMRMNQEARQKGGR